MNRLITIAFDNGYIYRSWNPNSIKWKVKEMEKKGIKVLKRYEE